MKLKEQFNVSVLRYNFGRELTGTAIVEFDHYPTEKEMLETLDEINKRDAHLSKFETKLKVEKVYQAIREKKDNE